MQAITISQPYASLIADGEKWIENRTWPVRYRGLLAIHAGKGLQYVTKKMLSEYPSGCVVAVADLVACVSVSEIRKHAAIFGVRDDVIPGTRNISWKTADSHKHAEGPFCWILQDVRKLEKPVPYRGAQGLWFIDDSLLVSVV